jgi:hypothetical protein
VSHPEDAALNLSWQPDRVDFTEAFRVRNRARKAWLKIWTMAGIALVVAVVLSITGTAPSVASAGYFVAVFFPLSALIIQPLSVRSFWRRNPALHGPLRARVDPGVGITLAGRSSTTHPWSIVHSFLETDRVFVVQLSGYRNLGFLLLAKRGLPSEWHVDQLRGVLSSSIVS